MGSTTGYVPNIQSQIRYITQWFHEWSEMQRSDFLPILADKFGGKGYVNGLLPGMDSIGCLEDKPLNIFQCRVKLFKEWADNWGQQERDQVLGHIKAMDPEFIRKYEEEISGIKPSDQEGDLPVVLSPAAENQESSE
ncbi:hypothetical protein LSTR_LSTR004396 [Laodelphax striatellus]|uniref:Uncharacterized protein n=1 Tax=Laodelphax striatellus TaxID=195883 RepID=A0A482X9W3_LAOST|nr:hypothetical protein LSTR_LSTR004396 [Laodelphax striatellus]